ncbi:hypothetical protein [Actinophytocola sp.]|uniref:hypothetical protein n=1 Tax=Actinophytocola sp. TaxID=1872138 RepID=UPI00389A08F0
MSLPGLVVLLVVLAALERFGLWANGRSWLPWRRKREGTPPLLKVDLESGRMVLRKRLPGR